MKKPPLLYAIALLILSCNFTNQQKANDLIKSYLKTTLNDPSSYESVTFGKIDTLFGKYEMSDPDGIKEYAKFDSIQTLEFAYEHNMDEELKKDGDKMNWKKYNFWDSQSKKMLVSMKSWDKYFEDKNKTFKGPINGYQVLHTYRAKNGFGALTLHSTEFRIDTCFCKVLYGDSIN